MRDFEIVIVDDGSTDHTPSAIAGYRGDTRFRVAWQTNLGLPAARNAGIALASGEYIAVLDADDELAPDALEIMASALDLAPDAGWCVIDILRIAGSERRVMRTEFPSELHYGILEEDFIRRAMFFRRTALAAVGCYDPAMRMREDWDLNIRLIHAGIKFTYVPRPLYWYHWRDGSITTARPHRKLAFTDRLLRTHHKRLADARDARAAAIYAECMWDLGRRQLYDARNPWRTLACVRESMRYGIGISRFGRPFRRLLQSFSAASFRGARGL